MTDDETRRRMQEAQDGPIGGEHDDPTMVGCPMCARCPCCRGHHLVTREQYNECIKHHPELAELKA